MQHAALVLLMVLLAAAPAAAQDPGEALREAEAQLASAQGSLEQRRALSAAIRAYESAMQALREDIGRVSARVRARDRALSAERADLSRTMAALARLGRVAEPMVLAGADRPEDGVRALMLLEGAAGMARARVIRLEDERAALAAMRAQQAALLDGMEAKHARLAEMRQTLIARIEEHRAAVGPVPDIGEDAANLAALAIALDSSLPDKGAAPPASALPVPVPGRLLRAFGAPGPAGIARPGIAVEAAAGALVTSPAAASVRFTGQLDGYGQVIILEPSESLLLVIAGLGPILVRAGESVATGAALAFLPGAEAHEEFSSAGPVETGKSPAKTIYMEVRRDQRPVDPLLWFQGYR